jgi:tRNA(fMet)-specific endonuclease VapC
MFLLDTDTYTHLFHQHPQVVAKVDQFVAQRQSVGVTIVTKIEAIIGRMMAVLRADSHKRFLDAQRLLSADVQYLQGILITPLDERSLQELDKLGAVRGLKKIGRTDLLIASIALAHRATLVTRNQKHFRLVPRLKIENWVD